MTFNFLVDTYRTELEKTLSVWCMFDPDTIDARPRSDDRRGRTLREHMVHQCMSEHGWFANMLGIDITVPVLPETETREAFVATYAAAAGERLTALGEKPASWWQEEVDFFDVRRSRAWVLVRRIAHTAHHRGQQTALLRARGQDLHSTYGPTADTGGLGKDGAPVIYPCADTGDLLAGRVPTGLEPLPAAPDRAVTERPE
ncbi:MAG: DinB family protein [bacterium]|nr:DinB family protein [bacterium]